MARLGQLQLRQQMSGSKKERLHGSNREGSQDPSFLVETYFFVVGGGVGQGLHHTIQAVLELKQSAWATTPAEILF